MTLQFVSIYDAILILCQNLNYVASPFIQIESAIHSLLALNPRTQFRMFPLPELNPFSWLSCVLAILILTRLMLFVAREEHIEFSMLAPPRPGPVVARNRAAGAMVRRVSRWKALPVLLFRAWLFMAFFNVVLGECCLMVLGVVPMTNSTVWPVVAKSFLVHIISQ